jgi:hypothetical protein
VKHRTRAVFPFRTVVVEDEISAELDEQIMAFVRENGDIELLQASPALSEGL